MATSFLTGQRLTADLLNANVIDFMPVTYTKTGATSRTSTTTLADDPELSGIALAVGTWEVELLFNWSMNTTATQKIKTRWAFTGTWNGSGGIRGVVGPGNATVTSPDVATEVNVRGYTLDTQDAIYDVTNTSAYTSVREICRNVVVTVAGNLSMQWAQNASSANATIVQAPSTFTVRKIST